MDVSKLSTNNWIAAGGGIVTFLAGFFPWFTYGESFFNVSQSGFDAGIFAILGILLTLAGAVILILKVMDITDVKAQNLTAEQIAMVLAAVGAIFILLRLLFAPDGGFDIGVSRAWGGFLAFLASAATVGGAFLSGKDAGIGIPSADDFTGGGDDAPSGGASTF